MNRGLKKQVHPVVAAVLVIAVLVGVQYAWWKGLIYKAPLVNPLPGGPSGPPGAVVATVAGRENASVDTFAGDLEPGSADGPGHAARFDRPTGLAIDAQGNIFVADTGNHRVRKVAPDGEVTTIAGGEMGYADGPAQQAKFNAPCGLTVSPNGVVYVADTGNNCIRRIQNGQVETVVGGTAATAGRTQTLLRPTAVSHIPSVRDSLTIADTGNRRVVGCYTDGGGFSVLTPGVAATAVYSPPYSAAVPSAGMLLLSEVLPGPPQQSAAFAKTRTVKDVPIEGASGDKFHVKRPVALWPTQDGWLVTDGYHPAVFLVHNGSAEVIAGLCTAGEPMRGSRDGDGSKATFGVLSGIVADKNGHVYVADTANNTIRRISM